MSTVETVEPFAGGDRRMVESTFPAESVNSSATRSCAMVVFAGGLTSIATRATWLPSLNIIPR